MATSFELFLLDGNNGGDIVALGRRGDDTAIETIKPGPDMATLIAFGQRIGKAISGDGNWPTPDEIRTFGLALFLYLFPGTLATLYNRLPSGAISLQIFSNRADIKEIPWEFLGPPDRCPVPHRERSVIRIHPTCGPLSLKPKRLGRSGLKVLLVAADPGDQAGVPWDDLFGKIKRTLVANMPGEVAIKVVPGATRTDLLKVLARETFDVFHFFGHGTLQGGVSGLVLQDAETGLSDFLPGADLAVALSGKSIRLALLSACLSSGGNYNDDFGVIATTLIQTGIPAVIANQYAIPYSTISPFVSNVYESLLIYGDIDQAVAEGRAALSIGLADMGADGKGAIEWGIPTLHRLADSRQLFTS